jgi:putative oxidoreductase
MNVGGWEYNAILAALGLLFLAIGSGRLGMDYLFVRPPGDGSDLIAEGSDQA